MKRRGINQISQANQINQTRCKVCNVKLIIKNEEVDGMVYLASEEGIMTLVGDNQYEWFCHDCYNELLNGVKVNPLSILRELDNELNKKNKGAGNKSGEEKS